MKDISYFLRIALIQSAFDTRIFPKFSLTLRADLPRLLYLLAIKAFDMLYFIKLHAINLTSLFELILLIVA